MENESINNKKDAAKEKIILFVVGVLVGAAISTVAFFVYVKTLGANNNTASSQQVQGGTPPEMPSGNSGNSQNGTPPSMPNSSSNSNSNNK